MTSINGWDTFMLWVRPIQRMSRKLCPRLTLCKTLKQDFGIFSTYPSRPLLWRPAMPLKDPHGPCVSREPTPFIPALWISSFIRRKYPDTHLGGVSGFAFQERFFLEPLKPHFQSHIPSSKGRKVAWGGFFDISWSCCFPIG